MKTRVIRFGRMMGALLLPLFLLTSIVLQAYGATPGQRLWVKRYNGPGNANDAATAMAVDSSGNIYVTGSSTGSGTGSDYFTIKYRPNGKGEWGKRYNGPGNDLDGATAMAIDSSGNIYVTGYSTGSGTSHDYATIKYGPNGKREWNKRYNGPGNGYDRVNAMAIDSSGNIYVTGYSYGSGTSYDYATIKYLPNGKREWVRRYNGPGNDSDAATAIAVDSSGNVYVTGYSYRSGTGYDYTTIKYDPNGKRVWGRRYNGSGNGHDTANAIAIDSSGNIYVTGCSTGSGTGCDYFTIKYRPNGGRVWGKRYNGPGNDADTATAMAIDSSGNIYVTGYTTGSGTGHDYTTIKYRPNGQRMWVKRYNGPGDADLQANAIAIDSSGNVCVTGSSYPVCTSHDYFTIKYRPDGKRMWVKRYIGPGGGVDEAREIAIDSSGNIYVTGYSERSGTGYDYTTIKYAP